METGFLNQIHDEEHFSSTFYNQTNGLDDSDHMLFGEMIVPEVIDYDNPWQSVDDVEILQDPKTRKEDFQKIVLEWRNQLNYMQEPEVIQQILPVTEKTNKEISEMFVIKTSAVPTDPCIDELFPLDTSKESVLETGEQNNEAEGEETPWEIHEAVAAINIKLENEIEDVNMTSTTDINPFDDIEPPLYETNLNNEATISNQVNNLDQVNLEMDKEASVVDVETAGGELPLLLAQDLTSLLEQFEATEKVNPVEPEPIVVSPSLSPPRPSSQTIRDALPAEVINRIKASRESHKKMVSVIPAMPAKKPGKAATRMQDAGVTLSRNKLLKLVTGGAGGETVSLDHDYCNNGGDMTSNSSRGYYMSDSSDYPSQSSTPETSYSRLPDYFMPLPPQKAKEQKRVVDSGSRKDSGLESGENSDEEPPLVTNKVVIKSGTGLKKINVVTENRLVLGSASKRKVPMVSVLKKNVMKAEKGTSTNSSTMDDSGCLSPATPTGIEDAVESCRKKKKLNLEEYRVRRVERDLRSQESSRANSPTPSETPSVQPDSTTLAPSEGGSKEKPVKLSVEVQTQTCDFVDLTTSKSPKELERSRVDRKEKRNDLKHRSYRSRRTSSSSSSRSSDSDRHHSHKRRSSKRSKHRKTSVSRMWSRSPSRSPSRSHSRGSSRSRSRDRRQNWRGRSPHRSNNRYNNVRRFHRRDSRERNWNRSRSPVRAIRNPEFGGQEKHRQVEERRVIYVGRIDEGTTKAELRMRFQQFGPIVDISVHFRERGDNYGFVTFAYKSDAYQAVEHGNDDPKQPRYDLCFGGRRAFCKQRYADLDGIASVHSQYAMPMPQPQPSAAPTGSFDLLLHEMKSQLRKRSSV